jgi:hypothetical protein
LYLLIDKERSGLTRHCPTGMPGAAYRTSWLVQAGIDLLPVERIMKLSNLSD